MAFLAKVAQRAEQSYNKSWPEIKKNDLWLCCNKKKSYFPVAGQFLFSGFYLKCWAITWNCVFPTGHQQCLTLAQLPLNPSLLFPPSIAVSPKWFQSSVLCR